MKKINFVNNDAPYLSAENLNQMQDNIEEAIGDTYSTEETFTGKYWIDGKKIYRKIIDFGALPNATIKNVLTGLQIESINIVNYYGIANGTDASGNRFSLTLPDTHPNGPEQATRLSINTKENEYNLFIITGIDRSNYTAYIIIEYTKTTD